MLKKLFILIGAIALLTLVIFVINNSGDVSSSEEVDEMLIDALRVGVHYDVKNMGYKQFYDDELSGFEIDFAKQLANHIYGKESLIEMTGVSMKTAKYYLNKKVIDCIIATQPIDDEKDESYRFSNPYYTDYIECIYSAGTIMSINDLAGKKIGVITDSFAAKKVQSLTKDAKVNPNFVFYEGYSDGIEAMQLGKIDAFCTNRIYVPNANLKRFTLCECKYAVVVRSEDRDLLAKINEAIAAMESSGDLKTLQDKYR